MPGRKTRTGRLLPGQPLQDDSTPPGLPLQRGGNERKRPAHGGPSSLLCRRMRKHLQFPLSPPLCHSRPPLCHSRESGNPVSFSSRTKEKEKTLDPVYRLDPRSSRGQASRMTEGGKEQRKSLDPRLRTSGMTESQQKVVHV